MQGFFSYYLIVFFFLASVFKFIFYYGMRLMLYMIGLYIFFAFNPGRFKNFEMLRSLNSNDLLYIHIYLSIYYIYLYIYYIHKYIIYYIYIILHIMICILLLYIQIYYIYICIYNIYIRVIGLKNKTLVRPLKD